MKAVQTLNIEQLVPGMVIAEAVLDPSGRVLVPVGTPVNEMTIVGLRRREVASVRIECEVIEDASEREAARGRLVAQLDRLFRQAGDGEEIGQVYQAVLAFRMEHRG